MWLAVVQLHLSVRNNPAFSVPFVEEIIWFPLNVLDTLVKDQLCGHPLPAGEGVEIMCIGISPLSMHIPSLFVLSQYLLCCCSHDNLMPAQVLCNILLSLVAFTFTFIIDSTFHCINALFSITRTFVSEHCVGFILYFGFNADEASLHGLTDERGKPH